MRSRVLRKSDRIGLLHLTLLSLALITSLLMSSIMTPAWGQLRHPLSTVDVGEWSVDDPFPTSNFSQNGAMQMHQHPILNNIFYVCTWKGTIIEVRRDGNELQERTIVDIRDGDHRWTFGCALHPDFRGDGSGDERIFLHYTTEASLNYLRISEIRLPADGIANSAHETVMIQNQITHREHVGGGLAFDNQGFLLVSIGDGGWHADSRQTSQQIDGELFSGIFRLDIDRRGGSVSHPPKRKPSSGYTAGYYIPSDNPFVGQSGVLEEFWSLGYRNPWRIWYDSERLAVWASEVGQDEIEQIELARAGSNHEWSFKEGSRPYSGSHLNGEVPAEPIGRLTSPLYEYEHIDQDYAVVGGFVYRGNKFPELKGKYIFGDNQSSRVWAIDPENPQPELLLRLPSGRKRMALTSISGDRAGNIYFTSFASINNANVLQLVRSTPANMPQLLSQTGIFTDLNSLATSAGFVEYDVNSPLWSDGMRKRRWLRLPAGQRIDNSTHENWRFPEGTVFVKHFEEPTGARRPIETRVLTVKSDGHVFGATYRWNGTQQDAVLQKERRTSAVSGHGGEFFQYKIPGARDCVVCHTYENPVLGVNGLQLSGSEGAAGSANDPIVAWSQQGLFNDAVPATVAATLPALAAIDDQTAPLEHRVRSYLHSNCSYCHYPTGTQRALFDARITTPLYQAGIIGERGMTNHLIIDGRRAEFIVSAGDPQDSTIFRRLSTTDREVSMPYLGRTVPHSTAIAAISDWITVLGGGTLSAAASPSPTPEGQTPSPGVSVGGCDYSQAGVNGGWGWNQSTDQSCAPLGASSTVPVAENDPVAEPVADGCEYNSAAANGGWGWNPSTQQSCAPLAAAVSATNDFCSYADADQNDGWGWNEATREVCPPEQRLD